MAELKPCPFCGSIARIHINRSDYHLEDLYKVMCCGCKASQPWINDSYKAFEYWNKRVADE